MKLTILADENIAHLDDYFSEFTLIKIKGRDITDAIDHHNPDALLIRSVTPINASTIKNTQNIRFIGTATIGIDHVDTHFLTHHGIHFANATGCSKHSVAQYVITAILTKNPILVHQKITLGVIGLGNIGSTLVNYANDLGWQVLGYDPYLPPSPMNNSTFDELLAHSDVISIHTPLTKHGDYPTYQLFNQATFDKIKNHAILINSARGEIIHQDDLLTAIDKKNLHVILDVFPHEPYIDKALLDKITIATPHIAGYTLEGKLRGTDMIYQAFCDYFNLPITQHMDNLLPPNPYHWQSLKNHLLADNHHILTTYYDILKDDEMLRSICTDKVAGTDFDCLRKEYHLKREWRYA